MWGNYELSNGYMVQSWYTSHKWDWRTPEFQAKVHGDGISGEDVWMNAGSTPRGPFKGKYSCMVVFDRNAYRILRNEIEKGVAWAELLASFRTHPKEHPPLSDLVQCILRHVVQRHCLHRLWPYSKMRHVSQR